MSIDSEWIVLDTNIWIFGLRDEPECYQLLQNLNRLYEVVILAIGRKTRNRLIIGRKEYKI